MGPVPAIRKPLPPFRGSREQGCSGLRPCPQEKTLPSWTSHHFFSSATTWKISLLGARTVLNAAREAGCPLMLPIPTEGQGVNSWKAEGHCLLTLPTYPSNPVCLLTRASSHSISFFLRPQISSPTWIPRQLLKTDLSRNWDSRRVFFFLNPHRSI